MSSCEVFEVKSNTWRDLAPMNEARAYHAALEVKKGILYVFSGQGAGGNYLDSIERCLFTRSINSWETIQTDIKLPGRESPGVISINRGNQVLIFGGYDGSNLADVFKLDTNSSHLECYNKDTKVNV